ncbi:hypothetical protein OKW41_004373 [Paraburkholderia sp. UCT70]
MIPMISAILVELVLISLIVSTDGGAQRNFSKAQLARTGVIVGAATQRRMELAIACLDRHVVDTGIPVVHQTIRSKLPVLVSVGAEPIASVFRKSNLLDCGFRVNGGMGGRTSAFMDITDSPYSGGIEIEIGTTQQRNRATRSSSRENSV